MLVKGPLEHIVSGDALCTGTGAQQGRRPPDYLARELPARKRENSTSVTCTVPHGDSTHGAEAG